MSGITTKQVDQMLEVVNKMDSRMINMERKVHGLTSGQNDATEVLKKAFLAAPGAATPAMVGWDGADEASLIRLCSKTKTLGQVGNNHFGEWLQAVGKAGRGMLKLEECHKVMKAFGSRHDPDAFATVQKAPNAEGSGATGGYLVPPQFYNKLLQFVAEKSFVKAACTTLPMQGLSLMFPYLNQQGTTGSGTANFPSSNFFGGVLGSWSPEASTATQTNPTFKQGTLNARTLLCQTVSSLQLIQDSFVALDGLITTLLTDSIAWQLDYAFLRANGVNQPLGITNAPGTIASVRGTSSTVQLVDMAKMISRVVMSDGFNNLMWVMNQSVLPQLIQMVNNNTSNTSLVWINQYAGGAAEKFPMKFFGIPIYFTEKCPVLGTAGDVMLLDMSKYLCGDRMNIAIESSPFPYFTSYQQVWRAVWRGDGTPWFDSAITLADGSTTVSPHVILAA